MAITSEKRGSVGKSRFYCDMIQYAKMVGMVKSYSTSSLGSNLDGSGSATDSDLFDFNPSNINRYYFEGSQNASISIVFKNSDVANRQWSRFLCGINYYGILGHDMTQGCNVGIGLNSITIMLTNGYAWGDPNLLSEHLNGVSDSSGIVGDIISSARGVGYNLQEITQTGDSPMLIPTID